MIHPRSLLSSTLPGPIGLSIGSRWIGAVQVSDGAVRRLRAAAWFERAPVDGRFPPSGRLSEAEGIRMGEILARQGFAPAGAVLAVTSGEAPTTMMELPPRASGAPLGEIAAAEIARVQRWDPGTFETTMWDLPETSQRAGAMEGTTVLAVSCAHAVAEDVIAPLHTGGLMVVGLDPACAALARGLDGLLASPGAAPTLSCVVNIGWESSQVVVLWTPIAAEGGTRVVVYERAIAEIGLGSLYASLKDRRRLSIDAVDGARAMLRGMEVMAPGAIESLDGSLAEVDQSIDDFLASVASETQRSMSYASRRYPSAVPAEAVVCGEGALLPRAGERLEARLGLATRVASLGQIVRVPADLGMFGSSPSLILAAGAAMASRRRKDGGA